MERDGTRALPRPYCQMDMRWFVLLFGAAPVLAQSEAAAPPDASAIMAKVAANVETAAAARRQFLYRQSVRSSLVRASGQIARVEKREYSVFPGENATEKKMTSFHGEYRHGNQMIAYSDPGHKY